MNSIKVKHIEGLCDNELNKQYEIKHDNWNYPSDTHASFVIAYDDKNIYLKYKVEETNVKAVYTAFNDAVWEDSCVEFFISFNGENYYNFEFNCIGTALGGYGANRDEREAIDTGLLEKITTTPSLGRQKIEIVDIKTDWTLDIKIPISTFKFDDIKSLKGVKSRCNFYKCGDKQVTPHFLSWNPIKVEQPNFHLPEYFGELIFE